jgi:hypothetical protein
MVVFFFFFKIEPRVWAGGAALVQTPRLLGEAIVHDGSVGGGGGLRYSRVPHTYFFEFFLWVSLGLCNLGLRGYLKGVTCRWIAWGEETRARAVL